MPKAQGTCKLCGVTIEFWPSQMRQFCSQQCRSKCIAAGGMPVKPKTGRYEPCETCGKPVWRRQHQIRDGSGRFCSRSCRAKAQTKEKVRFVCETCAKPFELVPSQAENQSGRFCSKQCESIGRIKRPLDRYHNGRPAVLDSHGYVRVYQPEHPRAMNGGWCFEHRVVAEKSLGRILSRTEDVHHLNGDKSDNRPENLEVLTHGVHARLTGYEREQSIRSGREQLAEYVRRFGPLT